MTLYNTSSHINKNKIYIISPYFCHDRHQAESQFINYNNNTLLQITPFRVKQKQEQFNIHTL
jgi:hypothetical protein